MSLRERMCRVRAWGVVLALAGTLAATLPAPALAQGQNGCITVLTQPGGGKELRNGCAMALNVVYCVDTPASDFSCADRRKFGLKLLTPQQVDPVPQFSAADRGPVYFAACPHPRKAMTWPGPSEPVFRCI